MLTVQRRSVLLSAFWIGTLGIAYFGLLAFMIFAVPHYERQFLEQRMKIPYLTELAIAASRACVKNSHIAVILFMAAYVFIGALLGLLRPRDHLRRRLWLVWGLLMGLAVLAWGVVMLALEVLPVL